MRKLTAVGFTIFLIVTLGHFALADDQDAFGLKRVKLTVTPKIVAIGQSVTILVELSNADYDVVVTLSATPASGVEFERTTAGHNQTVTARLTAVGHYCFTGTAQGYKQGSADADAKHVLVTETVSTAPQDRARLTLGLGEEVKISVDPAAAANWRISQGAGKLDKNQGEIVVFTAPRSPMECTVEASIGDEKTTVKFQIIAPTGTEFVFDKDREEDLGILGPPNNFVGAWTAYKGVVLPKTVSFYNAPFRERVPIIVITWPDGTQQNYPLEPDPGQNFKSFPWNGIVRDGIPLGGGEFDNSFTENSSHVAPIGRIRKDGQFVDFEFTVTMAEDYWDDVKRVWVQWVALDVHVRQFRGADQKAMVIFNNIPSQKWMGPFKELK